MNKGNEHEADSVVSQETKFKRGDIFFINFEGNFRAFLGRTHFSKIYLQDSLLVWAKSKIFLNKQLHSSFGA